MQATLWLGAAAALVVAGLASWADRRQATRSDLDAVGLISWPIVLIAAILAALVMIALAVRT